MSSTGTADARIKKGLHETRVKRMLSSSDMQTRPVFFNGRDALEEVAKADGAWNWALVGPDPSELPLVGGGSGSIEQMRDFLGVRAHSFGLLRMTFGADGFAVSRHIYVHASDDIDSGKFSAVERGKAMGVGPAIERAILKFTAVAGAVHVQSEEDCTAEKFIEKLQSLVGGMAGGGMMSVEKYKEAMQVLKDKHPEEQERMDQVHEEEAELEAPIAEVAMTSPLPPLPPIADAEAPIADAEAPSPPPLTESRPALDPTASQPVLATAADSAPQRESFQPVLATAADPAPQTERPSLARLGSALKPVVDEPMIEEHSVPQRRMVKQFKRGEVVEIYSASRNGWYLDAEVVDVVQDSCDRDGQRIRAGSMRIVYDHGTRIKWVAPQQAPELLRPSPRPRPPDFSSGELQCETHGWFSTSWANVYVELRRGWLQWWANMDRARRAEKPMGNAYMLGLQLQEVRAAGGHVLKLRASTGAVFAFRVTASAEEASVWKESLLAHAAYCEEVRDFRAEQKHEVKS